MRFTFTFQLQYKSICYHIQRLTPLYDFLRLVSFCKLLETLLTCFEVRKSNGDLYIITFEGKNTLYSNNGVQKITDYFDTEQKDNHAHIYIII